MSGIQTLSTAIDYLNAHGARVSYEPNFLSTAQAQHYWQALMAELEFDSPEQTRVKVRGHWYAIPRRQCAYGEPGTQYRFSGALVRAKPWTAALASLRALIAQRTGFEANFVLANLYRNGADAIGWHSDDEADLGPAPDIASLSLGAVRDFQFRRRDALASGSKTVTLPLACGSLLIMHDPTNKLWRHQLPRRGGKHPETIAPRLNLTWRRLVMPGQAA